MQTLTRYLSTGQQCMAGSRLFVHSAVHDEVAEGVAAFARGLKVGDGMEPDTVLGPMISARQKARVEDYIEIAKAEGAIPFLETPAIAGPGHFLGPVLFTGLRPGTRIEQEEISARSRASSRIAKGIDSGQVGINVHAAMSPETPFGGNRQSGWGREMGREGLDAYLETKAINIALGPKQ